MNVVVIGATGSIGRLAVAKLLEDGHRVTAFARRPKALCMEHDRLQLLAGDALDREAVGHAVAGQDSVVVTLGAGSSRTGRVRSEGTLNVIQAMQEHGVRRLVCQSTLGAHESWSNLDFVWKRIMFGLLLRPVLKDHELQEQLVQASGLDWTIVRPGAFSEELQERPFVEDVAPQRRDLSLRISRAEVADFLVRITGAPLYLNRAVGITH